jgi:hypothetical protein
LQKLCIGYSQAIFLEFTEEERICGMFQQDSATAHTARIPVQALSDAFGDRIISSNIWLVHSPDLNRCEFSFWGCLKDKVYNSNPRTEELKEDIRREIANIPTEQRQRVYQNLFRRCEECLPVERQHFQHL